MNAVIDGTLDRIELEFEDKAAVCVVLASEGYPVHYEKGKVITGFDRFRGTEDYYCFHAGTAFDEKGNIVTNGDQGVFATVSAIDGVVTGISKEIWKDSDGFTIKDKNGNSVSFSADASEKLTNAFLRTIIGDEIMNYMDDHWSSFATHNTIKDADGNVIREYTKIDPVKYMNAFATAASKAVSSDKAIANIQAVVLAFAAHQQYKDFRDDADDLAKEIGQWKDGDGLNVWFQYFDQDPSVDPWTPYALFEGAWEDLEAGDGSYYPGIDTSKYSGVYDGIFFGMERTVS
jgi:hypothetical protein